MLPGLEGKFDEIVVLVVVEVVEPCTHFPFDKISPNLEEQVLHATPPSL